MKSHRPATFSLIICTYNRAQSLGETLDSLKGLDLDGLRGEIILVDNNSSDGTRDTIESFLPAAPMTARYVFEPRQGLSHARNTGVDVAKGDVVVFSDDDVLFDRRWLHEILAAFADQDVAAVGGKILPKWPGPPPDWLGPELHGFLALLDHGDAPVEMKEPALWGANLAFRRDVFRTMRFHAALGRIGDKLYNGEDSDLLLKLIAQGERVVYWPRAIVHHNIPEQRLTKAYFRKWHWDAGSMAAQRMPRRIARSLLGIPYHFYRRTAQDLAAWSHRTLKRERDAFLTELQLVRTAGFAATRMKGLLRRNPEQRAAPGAATGNS
jgi:glycosyltransferase involved in cell wall biosynthesis